MKAPLSAVVGSVVLLAVISAALFGSAGTFAIPEFWIYLGLFAALAVAGSFVMDPELRRERMRPGGRFPEFRYMLTPLLPIAHWCVAGFDRGRWHVSDTVPAALTILGFVALAACWAFILWAIAVNRFFSSVPRIQAERGHTVVFAGPYQRVRHPGYAGAIVGTLASGLSLGSWLALLVGAIGIPLLIWRAAFEDWLLREQLPGYAAYAARVRYRLLPGVW